MMRDPSIIRFTLFLLGLALLPPPLQAQEQLGARETTLPDQVASEIIDFLNDPATIRFSGRSTIPANRIVVGDVAVLGGPMTVEGEIDGDLVVINGDLVFGRGGIVAGAVTVVGGQIADAEFGAVGGALSVYSAALPYRLRGGQYELGQPSTVEQDRFPGLQWGAARLMVRAGTNYNRIEGLPVMFGPVVRTTSPHQLRVDAFAVWRTESGFSLSSEDFGYRLRLAQRFGRDDALEIGGSLHSEIRPIETSGLTDLEASLATFLFHRDYRDYFEESGWSMFLGLRPVHSPLSFTIEYRDEKHGFAPVRGPWSLTRNSEPWRLQPVVAQGELRSVGAEITFDNRNDPRDPSDGWLVKASARTGVGGTLELPAQWVHPAEPEQDPDFPARDADDEFSTGVLDVARYARVGPYSQLSFRMLLGGSLNGDPLPPQFQHAFGGEGSIPGFRLLSGDCGARSQEVEFEFEGDTIDGPVPAYPAYGCDRMALFQVEYRRGFPFGQDWAEGGEPGSSWLFLRELFFEPSWTVFLNTGRGWSLSDDAHDGFRGRDTETLADLGGGLFFGNLGLYIAVPLSGDDRRVNFFLRLSKRI